MDTLLQDLRYAVRGLVKSPGFTAVALVTLAATIGANTAMFSVLNAAVLRPLPFADPDRLVMVWTERPGQPVRQGRSSYPAVEDWRAGVRSFAGLAVSDPVSMTLATPDGLQQISGTRVSPDYFALLGVAPVRGRLFTSVEADARQPVAVVSERFRRAHLGGERDPIGSTITVDGRRVEIVGILPEMPFLDADVWEPHTLFANWDQRRGNRGDVSWFVLGRLAPGATIEQAQAEATATGTVASIVPLHLHLVGPQSRLALWSLSAAVLCVLLIGVANIASLSLTRSARRAREFALRSALGAGQGRLMRMRAFESLVIATAAAALGVALAWAAVPAVDLDLTVLAWTLTISLASALLIGVAPALVFNGRDLRAMLHDGGRGTSTGTTTRLVQRTLVASQFAIALVLLVGAGLLVRSLLMVGRVQPGFSTSGVVSLQTSTPAEWNDARRVEYYTRVLERVRGMAGVEDAGVIGDFIVGGTAEQVLTVAGGAGGDATRVRVRRDEVSDRFFSTLGIPLVAGRGFDERDRDGAPRVAVVNETLARSVWRGQNPIGRQLKFGPPASAAPWLTVVGVVGDMRRQGLEEEPIAQLFEPLAQNPSRNETLLVRTSAAQPLPGAAIERAVREVDAAVPVYGVAALSDRLGGLQAGRRHQTTLVAAFSAVALLLAALGIYATLHYAVATRTQEIGVRMAVGAARGDIFRMVLREGVLLGGAGLAAGVLGALVAGRLVSNLLFGVTPLDPPSYLAAVLVLLASALAGCAVPAARASRVDPLAALRHE